MGEAFLVLLGLGLVAYVLVMPGVAVAVALRAARRAEDLEKDLRRLEHELVSRSNRARALEAIAAEHALAEREREAERAREVEPVAPPAIAAEVAAPPPAEVPIAAAREVDPAPPAEPPRRPEPAAPLPEAVAKPSFEEHLGITWLTRVGAAAFLLGALFFFKYAVDNAWIGPAGRVAVGASVGALILVAAEIVRHKTRARFVHALIGIGLATLFVSIWASAVFYRLVGPEVALAGNTFVLFLGAALSLRHRGEAILAMVLIAGFLNPVVLSTGQDRAIELFSYLILITSVAQVVSNRLGFRVVPALAIAGTAALFGGWYERFFDVGEPAGPYLALSARATPIGFVGLVSAQWIGSALWLRTREPATPARVVRWLAVTALVLAHAGAAVLLFDHPRLLAVAAIGVALGSIALLEAVDAADLLIVPMIAAFAAFAAVGSRVPEAQRAIMTALLGGWTAVYLAGFLRGVDRLGQIPARAAITASAGAALFSGLAGLLLIRVHSTLFVLVLTASSGVVAFLGSRSDRRALRTFAVIVSAITVAVVALVTYVLTGSDLFEPAFLAALAAFALVHLAAIAEDAIRRRGPIGWSTALTASAATLGAFAAALLATGGALTTARALIAVAAGLADLALGVALVRARPDERERASLLSAQALGFFAVAVAFALDGAVVTALWAALAVAAAVFCARTRERLWLAATALLFGAALIRAIAFDAAATAEQVQRFFATRGADGVVAAPVLTNPRAAALSAVGAALLAAAWLLARRSRARDDHDAEPAEPPFRAHAALGATLGYGLLIAVAITEVRAAATHLPPVPSLMATVDEWRAFVDLHADALASQRSSLAMITTLVLALSAAALLTGGFIARSVFHRYLGLGLFTITVAKLALSDVWTIERVYQIVLLTGVGALLVGGGFLYARFGPRLVELIRDGAPKGPPASPPPA